jgi:hypothetical protein
VGESIEIHSMDSLSNEQLVARYRIAEHNCESAIEDMKAAMAELEARGYTPPEGYRVS